MKKLALALVLTMAGSPCAMAANEVTKSPPAAPYLQVSKLVKLPDFLPGMGQLFVNAASLPAGPFLAYDHDGKLVSTIYMLPIKDLNPDKTFDNLAAPGGNVDHVDVYYNAGHPGVEEPPSVHAPPPGHHRRDGQRLVDGGHRHCRDSEGERGGLGVLLGLPLVMAFNR